MRILVCGDRNWEDYDLIHKTLDKYAGAGDIVVHGAARGADSHGAVAALKLGLEREPYPAQWKKYGRAAGPMRNRDMLDSGIDLVLAFHDNLAESKGTKGMVAISKLAGVDVVLVTHERGEIRWGV